MVAFSWPRDGTENGAPRDPSVPADPHPLDPALAEEILRDLAGVFQQQPARIARHVVYPPQRADPALADRALPGDTQAPSLEARYRALVEQIPAVVFMAYLDRGIGEAYVSPQIEAALECGSRRHVSYRQRAALGLPDCLSRWEGSLVSLRSQDDPQGKWRTLVHPRCGF